MALIIVDGPTILKGQSLSNMVDCSAGRIVRILTPPAWSVAPLTFQVSTDGTTFRELYRVQDTQGSFTPFQVIVPSVPVNTSLVLPTATGYSVAFIKIRSGTPVSPVPQSADRTFQLVLEVAAAAGAGGEGAAGPTGPAGPAGPVGPTGLSGDIGPAGSVGAAGPAGPTGPAAPVKGVIDGSPAAPGDKGEYISAYSAAAVNLTTLVTANVASISLPPGDWDIWGAVIFQPTSTGPNSLSAAISGVSGALPSNSDITAGFGTMSELWASSMPSGKRQVLLTGQCTSNSNAPKTVFLVAQASFGGGSVAVSGYISARRAR
jgi:hypothetical protein